MQVFLCQECPEDCSGNPQLLDINVFGAKQAFCTALISGFHFYSTLYSTNVSSLAFIHLYKFQGGTQKIAKVSDKQCWIFPLLHKKCQMGAPALKSVHHGGVMFFFLFLSNILSSSQEDSALESKLRPANFLLHRIRCLFSLEIRVNFGRP